MTKEYIYNEKISKEENEKQIRLMLATADELLQDIIDALNKSNKTEQSEKTEKDEKQVLNITPTNINSNEDIIIQQHKQILLTLAQ